jgi:hypothetical protein
VARLHVRHEIGGVSIPRTGDRIRSGVRQRRHQQQRHRRTGSLTTLDEGDREIYEHYNAVIWDTNTGEVIDLGRDVAGAEYKDCPKSIIMVKPISTVMVWWMVPTCSFFSQTGTHDNETEVRDDLND